MNHRIYDTLYYDTSHISYITFISRITNTFQVREAYKRYFAIAERKLRF